MPLIRKEHTDKQKKRLSKILPDILVDEFKVKAPTITFAVGGGRTKGNWRFDFRKISFKN